MKIMNKLKLNKIIEFIPNEPERSSILQLKFEKFETDEF